MCSDSNPSSVGRATKDGPVNRLCTGLDLPTLHLTPNSRSMAGITNMPTCKLAYQRLKNWLAEAPSSGAPTLLPTLASSFASSYLLFPCSIHHPTLAEVGAEVRARIPGDSRVAEGNGKIGSGSNGRRLVGIQETAMVRSRQYEAQETTAGRSGPVPSLSHVQALVPRVENM
ncbi:hypothetical protein NE237_022821 [Protea cynaroides]|uniref:Uncharacterized protein n=1 Tax=Protea cynaroides TaxID=273540 RepID=A0A9Q0K4U5_9MAGN|nr:hypothetical protein NE237_022821 [Protea cynaroides]